MRHFTRLDPGRVVLSPPSFQTYLEQKRPIDERSFHAGVWNEARGRLLRPESVHVLDVGTGTGAMVRRLIATWDARDGSPATLRITGVDLEDKSLVEARRRTASLVHSLGYAVASCELGGKAARAGSTVEFRFEKLDALSLHEVGGRFDLLTAHAVLDLLPLDAEFREIVSVLAPGGALYTTLNYDGRTEFLPPSSNATFERELLAWYNRTMDDRRLAGMPTGGSRCGTEMIGAAERAGMTVKAVGASDWNVKPEKEGYRSGEDDFLRALLWMVYQEGRTDKRCECRLLDDWLAERVAQIDGGVLGIRVAQTDMLAALP